MLEVATDSASSTRGLITGELVALDPNDPVQVRAAAELHAKLLGRSPVPQLGFVFMIRFYYTHLIRDGLIHCLLYRVGREYVGFLSFTERPYTFMSEGKRRHFFRLVCVLGLAVLAKQARLRLLWQTLTMARRKAATADAQGIGELLSFGVLEEFSTQRAGERGLRIPNLLFDAAIDFFRVRSFRRVEWTVDKDNLPAMIFYRSYGAKLEKTAAAWPGDYRVWMDL